MVDCDVCSSIRTFHVSASVLRSSRTVSRMVRDPVQIENHLLLNWTCLWPNHQRILVADNRQVRRFCRHKDWIATTVWTRLKWSKLDIYSLSSDGHSHCDKIPGDWAFCNNTPLTCSSLTRPEMMVSWFDLTRWWKGNFPYTRSCNELQTRVSHLARLVLKRTRQEKCV